MQILNGRLVARKIKDSLKTRIADFSKKNQMAPGLRVILIGNDPASQIYVGQKVKAAKELGIDSQICSLPENVSHQGLKEKIQTLNQNSSVHALLVQLPLPSAFSWQEVISWINPQKDPDCLTAENQGLAWSKKARVLPCTPSGIMELLDHYKIPLKGKKAVVVGRSPIVGLPMVQLLLNSNATVTVCHSHTENLSQITRSADIVVVAAGQPQFLGKEDFKKGAVVVDVGIHRLKDNEKKLVGDVRFEEMRDHVSFITPVPGGVGPMTVAMLLENTFKLACLNTGYTDA